MNAMIDCKQFDARFQAYLDHEMEYDERLAMEQHANRCPDCAARLEQAMYALELCAELNEGLTVPLSCQQAWREAIRGEARESGRLKKMSVTARGFTLVAAAVAVLMIGTMTLRQQGMLTPNAPAGQWARQGEPGQGMGARSAQEDLFYSYDPGENEGGADTAGTRMATVQSDGIASDSNYVDPVSATTEGTSASKEVTKPIVLRSAVRDIETAEFDTDYDILSDLLVEYDAYFEALSVAGTPLAEGDEGAGRVSYMTIRVPVEKLDAFLKSLDVVGKTTSRSEYAEDITARYTDTQLRIKALSSQLERLGEMADSAQTVEDLIKINDRASELLLEIESLEGTIRNWDAMAAYATVTLSMTETPVPGAQPASDDEMQLGERIRQSFFESVEWLKAFCADALVVLAMVAPQLVLWIPAAIVLTVLVHALVRRWRRRRA